MSSASATRGIGQDHPEVGMWVVRVLKVQGATSPDDVHSSQEVGCYLLCLQHP